tara:strand:- start:1314 stop:1619 length:306 start_codon:yes stop_codon:yes gene_type:complete
MVRIEQENRDLKFKVKNLKISRKQAEQYLYSSPSIQYDTGRDNSPAESVLASLNPSASISMALGESQPNGNSSQSPSLKDLKKEAKLLSMRNNKDEKLLRM